MISGPISRSISRAVARGLSEGIRGAPIPAWSLLDLFANSEAGLYPLYQPKTPPPVSADHIHAYDTTIGKDLYVQSSDEVFVYPASVVKLMTALLAWEYKSAVWTTETVTVVSEDVTDPPGLSISKAGLQVGDILTWEGLVYATLVPSGGDAALAIARIIGDEVHAAAGNTGTQGVERFVSVMNDKADSLGMVNTIFTDPYGGSRTNDGVIRNRMSARDASKMGAAAYAVPEIVQIAGSPTRVVAVAGTNPRNLTFNNTLPLVNGPYYSPAGERVEGVLAGKTGSWDQIGPTVTERNAIMLWEAPNGNRVVISCLGSVSNLGRQLDLQGIMLKLIQDFPYLSQGYMVSDASFANVQLLIGTDGGSATDLSNAGRTVTVTGVTTEWTYPIVGTSSLRFSNVNDLISVSDSPGLEPGASDFTMEMFFAGTGSAPAGEVVFFGKTTTPSGTDRSFAVNYLSGSFNLFISTNGSSWTTTIPYTFTGSDADVFFNGAPRHIALVRSGSEFSLWVNGEKLPNTITTALSLFDSSGPVIIGRSGVSALGVVDEVRYTIGNARYSQSPEKVLALPWSRSTAGGVVTPITAGLYLPYQPDHLYADVANTVPAVLGGGIASFDDLSGNAVTGPQPVSTARPIMGRVPMTGRRNLLPVSEDFTTWDTPATNPPTVTSDSIVGPFSGTAVDRVTANSELGRQFIYRSLTIEMGKPYTFYVGFKGDGITAANIFIAANASLSSAAEVVVSSATGEIINSRTFGGQFTLIGSELILSDDGWHLVAITATRDSGEAGAAAIVQLNNGTGFFPSFAGTGESCLLDIAQFENGTSPTPYQRVTNEYDVTEAGVPSVHYARYDLADDVLPQDATLPAITDGTVILIGKDGIWIDEGYSFAGGDWSFGPTTYPNGPDGIIGVVGDMLDLVVLDRPLTTDERDRVVAYGVKRGSAGLITREAENRVINGTFDTDLSQWARANGEWFWDNGAASIANATNESRYLSQEDVGIPGNTYLASWDVNSADGAVEVRFGGSAPGGSVSSQVGTGTRRFTAVWGGNNGIIFFRRMAAGGNATIDNVEVYRLIMPGETP